MGLPPMATHDEPPRIIVETWTGRIPIGAGSEMPAHFPETAPLVAPIWPANMRNLEIRESPADLSVVMEWTGAPGTEVQLMVEAPPMDDRVELYTAPSAGAYTAAPSLCVRVPPEAIVPGDWKIMAHTRAGADVTFTMTVRLEGGDGSLTPDMGHWMSAREFAERQSGGRIRDNPGAPCETP